MKRLILACGLTVSTLLGACSSNGTSLSPLIGTVLDRKDSEVGGGVAVELMLGNDPASPAMYPAKLAIPANALPSKTPITVTLNNHLMKGGAVVPTDTGVQIATKGVKFATEAPAKMQQSVPPPGPTRTYVAVSATDEGDWVMTGPAHKVGAVVNDNPDAGVTNAETGDETWEIDVGGTGLWAIGYIEVMSKDGGMSQDTADICVMPFPNCTVDSALTCDPVCQSGCGCKERCLLQGSAYTCVALATTPIAAGKDCAAETCDRGLLCLASSNQGCSNRCQPYCRTDADCPGGAHCSTPVVSGGKATTQLVCDNPPASCDPTFSNSKSQPTCADAGYGCYLMGSSAHADEAVCDCAGLKAKLADCVSQRECTPGLTCVNVNSMGAKCYPVCPLAAADADAATKAAVAAKVTEICGTKTCSAFPTGSTKYGICP